MTPSELTAAIRSLGLSAQAFARALGVSGRAVQLWQAGDRPIPQPVVVLLDLLQHCAQARQRFVASAQSSRRVSA